MLTTRESVCNWRGDSGWSSLSQDFTNTVRVAGDGLTCDGGVRCYGVCGPSILIRDGRRQSDLHRKLSQSVHVRPAMFPSLSFGQHLAPSVQNAIRLRQDLVVVAIDCCQHLNCFSRKCDWKLRN